MVANASLNPKFVAPPVPLTSLIGREHEVGLALTLLRRPEVRLLTLTGPGGIGKTSLALAIAAEIGPELGNGVYFAPLAGLTDPGSFASAVARAAGLVETSDTPVRDTLVSAFAQTESMLVLDNFEHLLAATHLVSDLLAVCPRLTIVVTSRVLLRISGEYALPVPPLAVPDAEGIVSRDALMQSAAGQLFAQRAQAIAPSFEVNDDNAVEVANICRRLDGVPLAIELAAARITHLSLPELLTLLERRLPLLTGGGRDRPLRLQTMRNAIAWSHDLLRPEEQVLFRRLAVFAGGFSLDAATFVAGDGEAPALDTVAALVEASMVRSETAASGPTRYWMLATIREFAEERLESSGEAETIRDQHTTYYANLADRFELVEMLANGDQALAQLDAEQDNVRAVLLRLEKQNEPERLLRLAAAFGYYWIARSHYVEGRAWLERSLALSGGVAESHASALVALGIIEAYQGSSEIAKLHLDEGLAGCRAQGDAFSEANALIALAAMAIREGDNVHATELLEACLLAAHAVPNQRLSDIMAGRTLINFAAVARALGDYELAVEHLRPALHLMRESGYAPGILLALGDLGDLARDQGNVALALDYYREALALGESHSGTREVSDVVEDVGVVASTLGQAERAATLLGAAESMRERIGLRFRVEQNQRVLDQAIAACRTALTEQAFAACWSTGRSLTPSQAVVAALEPLHLPVIAAGVHLTSREAEILRLLAAGLTDPAIADKLFISVRTVENHAARIFTKLGVRTRTAAVTSAIAKGLLHPDSPPPA